MNQCHYKPLSELAPAKLDASCIDFLTDNPTRTIMPEATHVLCTRPILPGSPAPVNAWCVLFPWRGKPRTAFYSKALHSAGVVYRAIAFMQQARG